jgi:hypothetical protein
MGRTARMPRTKKPKQHEKRIAYKLIPRDTEQGKGMYALLKRVVDKYHDELANARIALAWALAWKPDADGITKLGKLKKASDLDRELAPFDFVLLLRQEWWEMATVEEWKRVALLDHELCHATVRYDREGDPLRDERGRTMYRTRKHDIEEFTEIVSRHGLYKRSLEVAATALLRRQKDLPMEPPAKPAAKGTAAAAH